MVTSVTHLLMCLWQDGTGLLDVMALVTEDELDLMRTLDAEVRADVEAAARLLARQLQAQG